MLDAAIVVGNVVTEVLKTVADIADKPCKQTTAGFNAAAACIPFTVAYHISSGIFGVAGGAENLLVDSKNIIAAAAAIKRASTADIGIACSKTIKDDVEDLKVAAGETVDALAAIKAELALTMMLLEETRDLLLTPTGRREGFAP